MQGASSLPALFSVVLSASTPYSFDLSYPKATTEERSSGTGTQGAPGLFLTPDPYTEASGSKAKATIFSSPSS